MRFAITFDYLCPFAAIANETVIDALRDGAEHEVSFRSFSLAQVHLDEGAPAVWERPDGASGVLALQWGLAIRDSFPERFNDAHIALFDARHKHGRDINDPEVVRDAAAAAGLDPSAVAEVVSSGAPLKALELDHSGGVEQHRAFGVPTWIVDDRAVFTRLMARAADGAEARATVDRMLDLIVGWPVLNEFKYTRVPR
jgi:predicted DsbA family dithiol-disulfide isomerase